jgi:5'-deoxynucleotidase
MNIKKVLQSRDTLRFHNHSGIDKQPISDHQWAVAMIFVQLCGDDIPSHNALMKALTHDVPEYVTGDIPAPVKWENPGVKVVFDDMERNVEESFGIYYATNLREDMLIKLADMMEGCWYCIQQMKDGHQAARRPFRLWRRHIDRLVDEYAKHPWSCAEIRKMIDLIDEEKEKWDISK